MGVSKSAKYYRSNPEAAKKKAKKDKEINSRPEQIAKRVELNRENRKRGAKKGDGLDLSHTSKGLVYKPQSENRGNKKDSKGDKKARGGKK